MKTRFAIPIILICAGLASFSPNLSISADTSPSMVLYDNFAGKSINPARWIGKEINSLSPDGARRLQGNTLQMFSHGHGGISNSSNVPFGGESLQFISPNDVTAIKATVTVNGVLANSRGSCPGGDATASAQIGGHFFNDGSGGPDDATGDIGAAIMLIRSSGSNEAANVVHAKAEVYRCLDAACATTDEYWTLDLGKVLAGHAVKFFIWWDQVNSEFVFQMNTGTAHAIVYPYTDSFSPMAPGKGLSTIYEVPYCSASPAAESYVYATFDSVYVNR